MKGLLSLPRTTEGPGRECEDEPYTISAQIPTTIVRGECSELSRREARRNHGRKSVVRGLFVVAALSVVFVQPALANRCPRLIKEGKELMANAKLSAADEKKVKALLDESQKLHDNGSHGDSVKKANEALDLLKK